MTLLVMGLVLFLGVHSVRIFADDWRSAQVARLGEGAWKGVYALVSFAGFALIVWGYGEARAAPVELFAPPVWTRHAASLLTLVAFVLIAAAKVPRNRIRTKVGHPMVAGTKVWAFAHLLSNGRLADLLLFGAFLVWAVVEFRSLRQRDRAAGRAIAAGTASGDAITVLAGGFVWFVFAVYLHGMLFGVRPFG